MVAYLGRLLVVRVARSSTHCLRLHRAPPVCMGELIPAVAAPLNTAQSVYRRRHACAAAPHPIHAILPHAPTCSNDKKAASSAVDLRQLFVEQLQIDRTAGGSGAAGRSGGSTPVQRAVCTLHRHPPFLSKCTRGWAVQWTVSPSKYIKAVLAHNVPDGTEYCIDTVFIIIAPIPSCPICTSNYQIKNR